MSGDILDLIDGAVEAWETSCDAMRWSPDPAAVPAAENPFVAALERMMRAYQDQFAAELTPWQREVLARIYTTPPRFDLVPLRSRIADEFRYRMMLNMRLAMPPSPFRITLM